MANYTHEYSNFPSQLYTRHHFKDVDDSVGHLVEQIKELQARGEFDLINEIIKVNKNKLGQYVFGSEYPNGIDEELRNLEIFTKNKKQSIFYQPDDPEDMAGLADVWIG